MTAKKRILLLTTGGTIASVPGGEGLEPRRSEVMERELEQMPSVDDFQTVADIFKQLGTAAASGFFGCCATVKSASSTSPPWWR